MVIRLATGQWCLPRVNVNIFISDRVVPKAAAAFSDPYNAEKYPLNRDGHECEKIVQRFHRLLFVLIASF